MNFFNKAIKFVFEFIQTFLFLAIPGGIFLSLKKSKNLFLFSITFIVLFSIPAWLELWNTPKGFVISLAFIPLAILTNVILVLKYRKNVVGNVYKNVLVLASCLIIFSAILVGCILYQRFIWGYQLYHIPTNSMVPALLPGDYVLVNTRTYKKNNPKKQDIIVIKMPTNNGFYYLIKRVIFLEGDKFHNRILKKNELIVMGDNRNDSEDSRIFGAIEQNAVMGKAMWVAFSVEQKNNLSLFRIGIELK